MSTQTAGMKSLKQIN